MEFTRPHVRAYVRSVVLLLVIGLATASPNPAPLPEPEADPQTVNINAPFSGAIYIIGPSGVTYSAAYPAQCPNIAPQVCSNVGAWSWCCPLGNSCSRLSSNIIGCCPSGINCQGNVNPGQITTWTATIVDTRPTHETVFVDPVEGTGNTNPFSPTTTVVGGVFIAPSESPVPTGDGPPIGSLSQFVQTNPTMFGTTSICSTIAMHGSPGQLPTVAPIDCGGLLIVNGGNILIPSLLMLLAVLVGVLLVVKL